MGMTIEVYRINPETGTRTCVRRKRVVRPVEVPEIDSKYPPCICPRCRTRTASRQDQ